MKQEEERHSLLMNLVLTPERRVRPNTSPVLVSILLLYFSLSVSMHQNFETLQGLIFFFLWEMNFALVFLCAVIFGYSIFSICTASSSMASELAESSTGGEPKGLLNPNQWVGLQQETKAETGITYLLCPGLDFSFGRAAWECVFGAIDVSTHCCSGWIGVCLW